MYLMYVAKIEATKPYRTHFRQMEVSFTARDIEDACRLVKEILQTLSVSEFVEIIEVYQDDQVRVF